MYKHKAGFTLIEVLIVIIIISIIAGIAALSLSKRDHSQATAGAVNLLRARILLAQEYATLQNMTIGLSLSNNSYQFMVYHDDPLGNNWQILDQRTLGKQDWPSHFALQLGTDGQLAGDVADSVPDTPQIIIASSGDITPFTLDVNRTYTLSNVTGTLKIERDSN